MWFSNLPVDSYEPKSDKSRFEARPSHAEIGQYEIIIGPEQWFNACMDKFLLFKKVANDFILLTLNLEK